MRLNFVKWNTNSSPLREEFTSSWIDYKSARERETDSISSSSSLWGNHICFQVYQTLSWFNCHDQQLPGNSTQQHTVTPTTHVNVVQGCLFPCEIRFSPWQTFTTDTCSLNKESVASITRTFDCTLWQTSYDLLHCHEREIDVPQSIQ